jgi:hypothetical protein
LLSSVSTALFRSTPMMIRSLAHSRRSRLMLVSPDTAACTAAMLTKFASSAPDIPAVPRAMPDCKKKSGQRLVWAIAEAVCGDWESPTPSTSTSASKGLSFK